MNAFIKQLSADKTIWRVTLLSLIFIGLSFALILIFYHNLPPLLPLFNQLPWGTARLSPKITLAVPILVALGILIGNTILSRSLYESMPITARMLSVTTFLISLITLIFIFRTIQIIL